MRWLSLASLLHCTELHATTPAAVQQAANSAVLLIIKHPDHTEIQNGVLISATGHILTVYHGLNQAQHITAHLADGRSFSAAVHIYSPNTDSATLAPQKPLTSATAFLRPAPQLPQRGDKAFNLGRLQASEPVTVITGQWLMAQLHLNYRQLGDATLAAQNFSTTNGLIHTGAIQQGWSGSPVVNAQGQLIAINHAIFPNYQTHLTLASLPTNMDANSPNSATALSETAWVLEGLQNYLAWRGFGAQQIRAWLSPAYALDARSAFRQVLAASDINNRTIIAAN
ncbi:MAG: S1C family serine protease [Marinagarivorans sp.]|nr:S1C family serine protease [Marinagarivorans sp.]